MSGLFIGGGGGSGDQTFTLTNGNAAPIVLGQAVFVTTTNNASDLATAAADAPASRLVAVVAQASIAPGAAGVFRHDGPASALFEPALVLVSGNQVYLSSSTPGSLTNVPPAGAAQVVVFAGIVKDVGLYNGVGILNAEIMLETGGPKSVNP